MGRPSRSSDQFILRLPEGMRDRIKAVAEANNRSMNAEIIATLEEVYPAPRLNESLSDLELFPFQWHAGEWRSVDYDSWIRFRSGEAPPHIVNRMADGGNYFVVAVFDVDYGLCNLIVNNFKLVDDRAETVAEDFLTPDEREEFGRLYRQTTMTEDDERRLHYLRDKMEPAFRLPPDAVAKLREKFQGAAPSEVLEKLLARVS